MTPFRLICASLRFYWKTHLGAVAGSAIGAMVIVGALLVGDSVKATLLSLSELRIGRAQFALSAQDRFIGSKLADRMASGIGARAAPLLLLEGSIATTDESARVNRVQILGVDERFWQLSPSGQPRPLSREDGLFVNRPLAALLDRSKGETVLVRLEKPGLLSKDAPLSAQRNSIVAIRATMEGIIEDEDFGRFSTGANQRPPFNVYLPLTLLQSRLGVEGKINHILASRSEEALNADEFRRAIQASWKIEDLGLRIVEVDRQRAWALRSDRLFLDAEFVEPFQDNAPPSSTDNDRPEARPAPQGVLTYFVDEIRYGESAAPYAIVTAVAPRPHGILPFDLGDEEIVINQWLQDDLRISIGDSLEVSYRVVGNDQRLVRRSEIFILRGVIPMNDPRLLPGWMPDFPGISGAQSCRQWETGLPIDLGLIRPQDEEYWENYRGTPKAFITLRKGQEMWSNRWGELTGIRFNKANYDREQIARSIREHFNPFSMGLHLIALEENAQAASRSPVDFGQLFAGFSFFLILAAAALTGLLFVFTVEQRSAELGLYRAEGFTISQVRSIFIVEGSLLAAAGCLLGALAAVGYTEIVLMALSSVWRGAVGAVSFSFQATPIKLVGGFLLSFLVALTAMVFTIRRRLHLPMRELLSDTPASNNQIVQRVPSSRDPAFVSTLVCLVGAVGLITYAGKFSSTAAAILFFVAGALLLAAGIGLFHYWMARNRAASQRLDLVGMGMRNVTRRSGRSLASAGILASGIFIVIATTAFRKDVPEDTIERKSGTGGFALIAESSVPVYEDLNSAEGRQAYGLREDLLGSTSVVPMRLLEGDDASCLNLNQPLQPQLLGARPHDLAARRAFRFSKGLGDRFKEEGWAVLQDSLPDGSIPAVADDATVQWSLKKSIGDTLTYTNEKGEPIEVRIVATIGGSILQGNLIVSEGNLTRNFPSIGGYRIFLIDVPKTETAAVAGHLSERFSDHGMEIVPAWKRLAEFQTVENTYLSIFQVLGGFGLVLGSLGLGIVLVRNLLERKEEFALLRAIGYDRASLRFLIFSEYGWLILWGLSIGIAAAGVAVWPYLTDAGSFPIRNVLVLLAALGLTSLLCAWMAAHFGLKSSEVGLLQNE